MERKESIVAAFVLGLAAGSVWSAFRRIDRWQTLNEADRVGEEHEALTNFVGGQFDGLYKKMDVFKKRLDEVAVLMGDRRRGGVTTLPPRDGGQT